MASYVENLRTRRLKIAQELAALDQTKPGGLPELKSRDGGTDVAHNQYKLGLYKELSNLDKLIADASAADEPEPFEIETNANAAGTDLRDWS